METEATEAEFVKLFANATSLYPNAQMHEGSGSAYWKHLRRYGMPVLKSALRNAVRSSPDFFPSAERVRECADAASKTAQLVRPPERPALPPAHREYVPPIGAGAEEWVTEAKTACEKLARMWQVESKTHGWDRGAEMPTETGKRRLSELLAAFESQAKTAEERRRGSRRASTSGEPTTASGSESVPNTSSELQQSAGSSAKSKPSHGGSCVCELCFVDVMDKVAELEDEEPPPHGDEHAPF